MANPPVVDDRDADDLRSDAAALAPYYTEDWDPDGDDAGAVLLELYAGLAADVVTRLNRVPEKHRLSFLDTLGFGRQAPQPARLPLTFEVADGLRENRPVPAGTQAVAPASAGRPEQTFEIGPGDGFEATPATPTAVYGVVPETDQLIDHTEILTPDTETRLFVGENRQRHALFVGDADSLTLEPGDTIRVLLTSRTPVRVFRDHLIWEYYGTGLVKGTPEEGWHRLDPAPDAERPRPGIDPETVEAVLVATEASLARTDDRFEWIRHHGSRTGLSVAIERAVSLGAFEMGAFEAEAGETFGTAELGLEGVEAELESRGLPEEAIGEFVERLGRTAGEPGPVSTGGGRGTRTLSLALPEAGELVEHEVDGTKSKWIRCRIPEPDDEEWAVLGSPTRPPDELFEVDVSSVSLAASAAGTGLVPDAMLANDVPLAETGEQIPSSDVADPFGRTPHVQDAFYLASEPAFTKPGSAATVEFQKLTGSGSLDISWEYWDGEGWSLLDLLDGSVDTIGGWVAAGSVGFTVPEDLAGTTVAGHEGHWIRARLTSGDPESVTYQKTTDDSKNQETWTRVTGDLDPPRFGAVTVDYHQRVGSPPEHLQTVNSLTYSDYAGRMARNGRPFEPPSEERQTLYAGFDAELRDGPINLFVAVPDIDYESGFYPRIRWEYCADPADDEWVRLDVRDGTESLTRLGILSLVFPEPTVSSHRFGRTRHWIRGRVTGREFDLGSVSDSGGSVGGGSAESGTGDDASTAGSPCRHDRSCDADPCGDRLTTEALLGDPVETPPVLLGLYVNSGWAENVRTVSDEILGSSDGTAEQTFTVSSHPVTAETVWVDESETTSPGEREALRTRRPAAVEEVRGTRDELTAFWVAWTRVEEFLDSSGTDRHYTVDPVAGEVTFGDGVEGRIPPRGSDNVRIDYRTGGGVAGNVPREAVDSLKSSIAFVEGVTNYWPGEGGADAETNEQVLARAPKAIRDRGSAVASEDYERIALAASRRLARARCIDAMDDTGAFEPGWVTVVVVPQSPDRKPTPSVETKERVFGALAEHAPASLVHLDPPQLVVRAPSYVEISVTASVVAGRVESVSTIEETVTQRIEAFLHPLTGGPTDDGWAFGSLPCPSEFYALLEGLDGVDHVADLSVAYRGQTETITVGDDDSTPDVAADALIHSGTHDVEATADGGR